MFVVIAAAAAVVRAVAVVAVVAVVAAASVHAGNNRGRVMYVQEANPKVEGEVGTFEKAGARTTAKVTLRPLPRAKVTPPKEMTASIIPRK